MVRTSRRDFRPLAVYLRDEQGGIIAGLFGFTWAGWLEIKFVWVGARGPARPRPPVGAGG